MDTFASRAETAAAGSIGQYLDAIGLLPVLNRAQVTALCKAIEVGVLAGALLDDPAKPRRGATEAELHKLRRLGEESRQALIRHNLRLVVSVAKRMATRTSSLGDLIQAGNRGLIDSVQRYDWSLGYTFATYATWWIRKHVSRELEEDRLIRVPEVSLRRARAVVQAEHELSERHSRQPTIGELASEVGLRESEVRVLRGASKSVLSLDGPASTDETVPGSFVDLIVDDQPDLAESLHTLRLHSALSRALMQLDDERARVLTLRYGLDGRPPRSPHLVAQLLHTRASRVNELEGYALTELQEQLGPLR